MIIDLLTNSKDIVEFVKESEEFGGIIDKQEKAYVLINIQIGFLEHFYEALDKFLEEKKIENYWYRILNPQGIVARDEGKAF